MTNKMSSLKSAMTSLFNLPLFSLVKSLSFPGILYRLTAAIILVSLLSTGILFQPILKASASSSAFSGKGLSSFLPWQQARVIPAQPPVPFIISNNNFLSADGALASAFHSLAALSTDSILGFFSSAEIPAGLPQTASEQATPAENAPPVSAERASLVLPAGSVRFDFDGDGKADVGRWRASSSEWKIKNSSNGNLVTHTLGTGSAVIAPGDFDGDGKTDAAVYNAGTWTIKRSSNGTTYTVSWGTAGDKPVVGDYDADGISDIAIFRPSTNTWWVLKSTDWSYYAFGFGIAGDITVQGNYDGDSQTDIAVFRPSNGTWYIQGSSAGFYGVQWGAASDVPVPADFDGDGKTDLAVYRGATGSWYVAKSSTNYAQYIIQSWGNYGDQPVAADYDGDGKDDFAVWRPTTGTWFIIKSSNQNFETHVLGVAGEMPIPSAYLRQVGSYIYSHDLAKARLSPKNSTGGTNLYSRNFSWAAPLFELPGRANFDVGLSLSYNSLIWTKDAANNTIVFNTDNSNVSPGFRFGFPVIEPAYFDGQTGNFSYLMVTSGGARIEFRQTSASDTYETADSSYTQLKINGAANPNSTPESLSLTVTSTDGTQMSYEWKNGAYRCQKITDRNGNFITVNHDNDGLLRTVTDTLGRVLTVNYDTENSPASITQTWKLDNGAGADVTHTWATFTYSQKQIYTNFQGMLVIGPGDGSYVKALQKVTFPDGAYTSFDYNTWGQVKQISNYAADNHQLSYIKLNLPADATNAQTDCPRFTETRNWVENFNQNQSGAAQEVIVTNSITENQSYNLPDGHNGSATLIQVSMANHPQNHVSKTFVGSSGWMESLPIATEDWADGTSGAERKRWTWTNWTQDNTSLSYILNPRVIESKTGDAVNIKRTTTEYHPVSQGSPIAQFGLVKEIKIYDTNQTTVLKRAEVEYQLGSAYTNRRLIGLPLTQKVYDQSGTLVSKVTYGYDEGDFSGTEQTISPIQHNTAAYGAGFIIGRGNQTSVTQWDSQNPETQSLAITSNIKYNLAGAPVAKSDPVGRIVKTSYTDSFADNVNRNTFAYATKLTTPGAELNTETSSFVKYRYDTGANVRTEAPAPFGGAGTPNSVGKITTRSYDSLGRLEIEKAENSGAYTKYVYYQSQNIVETRTTVTDFNNNNAADAGDEVSNFVYLDGVGRTRATRIEHPGSTGGWAGQLTEYDILGRLKRQSVMTEINNSLLPVNWQPAGDDSTRGWVWTSREYDWKGRVTREINTDGTDKQVAYAGCGCAGADVETIQGESITETNPQGQTTQPGRRTQRIYSDALGRQFKTEILNWDGSVYSSTVTKFNGRDQADWVKQFDGAAPSDALNSDSCPVPQQNQAQTCQITKMTYDGHGRLKTSHSPQQDADRNTIYEYYADNQLQSITDARGAKKNFEYEHRGLLKRISYNAPPNGEALRPGISIAGRSSGGSDLWVHGTNFANDMTVIVFSYHIAYGGYQLLGTYTGSQLTRGTTSNGEQSVTFQVNSTVIDALNNNRVSLYVKNNVTGRTSNLGYQMYNGQWAIAPGNTAEIVNAPSPIEFTYDNVGNRTSMVDEVGRVDYEYDQVSRLKSETRAFSDSLPQAPLGNNSYRILYQYNFNNKLKSVTDPFGYQTSYAYDKTGKTSQVSGQVQFASDVKYRAWGGIKEVSSYGGVNQTLSYDNRLRISEYRDSFSSGVYTKFTYGYQADGTLFKIDRENQGGQTTVEMNFNRHYQFDHMGRMIAAKTGKRARGETADDCDVPFELEYTYDKFGHIAARSVWNRLNSAEDTVGSGTYVNNRADSYMYDADGRVVGNNASGIMMSGVPGTVWQGSKYRFNAAGLVDLVYGDDYKQELWQDGNEINVKQRIWTPHPDTGAFEARQTTYNIQSSVLKEVIARADQTGSRIESFVYGLGKRLGTYKRQKTSPTTNQYQEFQLVERTDPSGTYHASLGQAPDGASKNAFAELTPENVNVYGAMQVACPYEEPPPQPPIDRYDGWRFSSGHGDGGGCTIDGVEASCATAMGMLANGSGYEVALGTSYFDLYDPNGRHVGGGVLSTGWMPIDSFGTHRESISAERAANLASPTGHGLSSNWREVFGLGSVSTSTGNIYVEEETETTITNVSGDVDNAQNGFNINIDVQVSSVAQIRQDTSNTPAEQDPMRGFIGLPGGSVLEVMDLALMVNRGPTPLHCQPDFIAALKKIWRQSGNGATDTEASFNVNGTPSNYKISMNPFTNQRKSQSIPINTSGPDKTYAIVHVHPNSGGGMPSTPENNYLNNGMGDTGVADKYGIMFYVVHKTGLRVYDPSTGQTTLLRSGLDWAKACP